MNLERNNNCLLFYGKHAVIAAIKNRSRKVIKILVTSNTANEIREYSHGIPIDIVKSDNISKLLPQDSVHQGVACYVSPLEEKNPEDVCNSKILLMLDQVTDPRNIGAILRSAAAFGAGGVIVQDNNSPRENGAMAKAASGALEAVPLIKVTNLSQVISFLKDREYWCVGLDGSAETDIRNLPKYEKIVLVLGAEGKGLRRLVRERCDILTSIPISSDMESLNISNAAAISLFELS